MIVFGSDAERQNAEALDACQGPHDFRLIHERGEVSSRAQFRCRKCSGVAPEQAAVWYRSGLSDGIRQAGRGRAEASAAPAGPRNIEKLAACQRPHAFTTEYVAGEFTSRARARCRKCDGTISGRSYKWWQIGCRHGRRFAMENAPATLPDGEAVG